MDTVTGKTERTSKHSYIPLVNTTAGLHASEGKESHAFDLDTRKDS